MAVSRVPRVVHISSDTGLFGGKDRVLLWLLSRLSERNLADPWFVCFKDGIVANHYRNAGISVEQLTMKGPFDIAAVPRFISLLRDCNADLIHTHDHKSHVLARLSKLRVNLPVVSTLHGLLSDAKEIPWNRRFLYGIIVKSTDHLTDHWIAVSQPLFERLGPERSDVSLVPNAVDAQLVRDDGDDHDLPQEDGPVILCLGRLSHEKGQDILLESMKSVFSRYPDTVLWLAGEGPLRDSLYRQAASLMISDRVRFLGFREAVSPLLRAATILVLPSRNEGTPISVLEAMCMGVPVVSTRVGGVPHLIPKPEIGMVVPPENPTALTDALLTILGDRESARRIGNAGRIHVERHHSLDLMAERTAEIYRKCLSGSV